MDRKTILEKYKRTEDKLIISKFLDKIELSDKTSKIETTDFLNELEQSVLEKVIKLARISNCKFYGGIGNADRKLAIIYPEQMRDIFEQDKFRYDTLFSVFRIIISEKDAMNFNHSVFLGGILKLGVKREKIGDIIVFDNGADIIVKKEIEKFLYSNLQTLTRFRNAKILDIKLEEVQNKEKKFEEIKVITSSLRLDNIVSELARTSRNKANEILEQERVFINYEVETKSTKQIKEMDIITIRGKGKFIIDEVAGNTKKGNIIIIVKKYA